MLKGKLHRILFMLISCVLVSMGSYAQSKQQERHILVSLRMIGHQILLNSGDSTSRVLPVEKTGDAYRIQFASAFAFNPGELVSIIDRLTKETKIARNYIVEVKRCENDEVVYSYEKGDSVNPDFIPCGPRTQPKGCYVVFFSILNGYDLVSLYYPTPQKSVAAETKTESAYTHSNLPSPEENKSPGFPAKKQTGYSMMALPIGSLFVLVSLFVFFRRKKVQAETPRKLNSTEILPVGDYQFDKKNMTLTKGAEITELSSKETDLLILLYSNENKTLEREYILKVVWGDEGDYIGRTLDVFISKLRKKLEADSKIKIINIRGIGYKFIVN